MPPARESWNGVLTSYTVISNPLGPNNMSTASDLDLQSAYGTDAAITTFQIEDNKWFNNPDPRIQFSDVTMEEIIIDELQEFYTYKFNMYMSNAAGDSDLVAASSLVKLPGTGKYQEV